MGERRLVRAFGLTIAWCCVIALLGCARRSLPSELAAGTEQVLADGTASISQGLLLCMCMSRRPWPNDPGADNPAGRQLTAPCVLSCAAKAELRAESAAKRRRAADDAFEAARREAGADRRPRASPSALTIIAKKRLQLKHLEKAVSDLEAKMANRETTQGQQVRLVANQLESDDLAQEVKQQAEELHSEKKEISFLKQALSAHGPNGKNLVSYVGKILKAAGFSGSRAEKDKITAEQKEVADGWAELRRRKEERTERAKLEAQEFDAMSKRIKDLEDREEEDRKMAEAREGSHEQAMKVGEISARALMQSRAAARRLDWK
jgi:hypothetical protein